MFLHRVNFIKFCFTSKLLFYLLKIKTFYYVCDCPMAMQAYAIGYGDVIKVKGLFLW